MNSVVLNAALVSVVRRSEVRRLAVWEVAAPRASRPPTSGEIEVLMRSPPGTFWLEPASQRCSATAEIEDLPEELQGGRAREPGERACPAVVIPLRRTA